MRKHNFVFVDIEATGMNPLRHEIIEIGCVLTTSELEILEEFEIKIKPDHIETADPVSLKVNQYHEKDWEGAMSILEGLQLFLKKVKNAIMVGHNVAFDAGFLEYNFYKLGLTNTMHYHKLDTVSMAWAKLHSDPNLDHFSLHELSTRFGIKNERAHSALPDARTTYELYKKLLSL
jgi:DNA polymerase III epsilon subunit family exonuclease